MGAIKRLSKRRINMNFTTWFVIAIAIIVPVMMYVFNNKE